jgi:hypothetical protein
MKLQTVEERLTKAKEIFDDFIMKELLSCSHVSCMQILEALKFSLAVRINNK